MKTEEPPGSFRSSQKLRVIQLPNDSRLQRERFDRIIGDRTRPVLVFQECQQCIEAGAETDFKHVKRVGSRAGKVKSVPDENMHGFGDRTERGMVMLPGAGM
jgi:hypothetical protein